MILSSYQETTAGGTTGPGDAYSNRIGRELGRIDLAVDGEKNYLNKYLQSNKRQALRWIGEDTNDPRPGWLHKHTDPLELVMRTNDVLATAAAIQHGLGVGRLPTFAGDALT